MTILRLGSLEEAAAAVRALASASAVRSRGTWTAAQALNHCAASVECSLTGYPRHKPVLIQKTVGRLVLRRFLKLGRMKHDLAASIPGMPDPLDDDVPRAAARLLAAIEAFRSSTSAPAPHFVYGQVTRDAYDRLHAMHIADHLSALEP